MPSVYIFCNSAFDDDVIIFPNQLGSVNIQEGGEIMVGVLKQHYLHKQTRPAEEFCEHWDLELQEIAYNSVQVLYRVS